MRISLNCLVYFTIILVVYWFIISIFKDDCASSDSVDSSGITIIELNRKSESNIYFSPELKSNGNKNLHKKKTFFYNRYLPLVFISGVPGIILN